jgi:formylglycine-generating enzyme required for sulfatase activity
VADLFVSYKREDRVAVERIISRLTNEGYSVWWDSRLEAGENFGESIAQELDEAKCVLVIWSQASVGSKWVYAEATEADNQGKLVPVIIESCRVKPPFNILHCFNLAGDKEEADSPVWTGLLAQIRSLANPTGSSAPDDGEHANSSRHGTTGLRERSSLNFVRIPAGACEHKEGGFANNSETVTIEIDYDFAISKFAATVAEWEAAIADGLTVNPPREHAQESSRLPVVNVSWDDALQYGAWLSDRMGKTIRLPSEAEWEYACRANGSSTFSFGETLNQKQACCRFAAMPEHSLPKGPVPVGSFPPNSFGLYEMHGNVWEWTMDCWQPSLGRAGLDGSPMLDGDYETRVIRGGSWANPPENAGCSTRGHARKNSRNRFTGFRLVMECK